jgi:hypothetical protein
VNTESSPPDRSHYSNDRTDEYFLLMRKFRSHLTKQEREAVVQRVVAKDADGNWIESYRKIAEAFNVTVPCISQTARRAGIAPRWEPRAPKIRFHPPPQLYDMYATLVRKVGAGHAKQIVQEHMRIRGIYDPSTRAPERRGGDDSNIAGISLA